MGRSHLPIVHPIAWKHAAAVRAALTSLPHSLLRNSAIELDIEGHEVCELDWTKDGLPEDTKKPGAAHVYPHSARCRWCGERRFVLSTTRWIVPAYAGACRCQPWTTRERKLVPWSELDDQHLLHITAMLSRMTGRETLKGTFPLVRDTKRRAARVRLAYAIAELRYRDLLPTQDELRVAVDRCCDFGLYERDGKPIELMGAWAKFGLEMTRRRRPWAVEGQDERHPSSQLRTA